MKIQDIQLISLAISESNPSSIAHETGYTPILQARLNLNSSSDQESIKDLIHNIFKVDFIDNESFNIKFLNNNREPVTYPDSEIATAVASQDKQRLIKYFLFKQFQITGLDVEIPTKSNVSFTSKIKRRK
ncbi:hypothetical protein ACXHQ0_19765 [Vibrio antiquarius]|uniref:Uncharacterized protein n=1 Tax=Vibrio parahaemolyticus TaxID=670 RepID=A0AA46ZAB1_VIBPH|nr:MULTISPECIES: hypothetical protein [Vibrio harveyi group]MCS0314097.1 hypothetical protein [Vibrio diabolicus]UYV30475.1 hypothetical protein M5598_26060 [Vibrio parahaemolyticus]UYW19515.1 hypothetical protein IF561_24600 [Vibrio parahaemolyticus]